MSTLDKVRQWLAQLSERERRMVTWGGIAAVVFVFFVALLLPLYAAVSRAEARVARKADDLNWMRSVAAELRAAGPVTAQAGGGQSLLVIVDQSARQAGLGSSLSNIQPSGAAGGVRARLENASFDIAVAWLSQLQQRHGVSVESATIDRAAERGMVNASIILKKAG